MWALGVCWVVLGTLGAGSAQLLFLPDNSVTIGPCNESVTLPCVVTNLKLNRTKAMFVKWRLEGKEFFAFDGFDGQVVKNATFQSAKLLNEPKLPKGVASLVLSRSEAVEGNYTCEVVESNREGEHIVELKHSNGSCGPPVAVEEWLQRWEKTFIVIAMLLAAVLYWIQLVVVALKFDMTGFKKICLSCAGLIVTVAAVTGSVLFLRGGAQKVGLGLLVIPAAVLVPLLFFLLASVFEKLPRFAIILIVLKALGYLIALVGFALCVSVCVAKQSAALIAGIVIIDNVAAIGVIYVTIVGSNMKDHQLPRHA
ncbi:leukocyte surface antigen CD47 isoform X2 [Tiliqua scincoides]|uniref:leukocyte surface antigen CD47 isoform X2 n=1 Tax=Tiliqua scincoides TaxID=71010 RepID=UPI0034619982